ncbi:MAG: FecR domain-containing protein [Leptospiraceae bacterium]|nr:FecR domain-containing protein [Leptospiraceae bacterium]MCP5500945.1 FecR domain-containing protein [Leptospiraceae bacterium]
MQRKFIVIIILFLSLNFSFCENSQNQNLSKKDNSKTETPGGPKARVAWLNGKVILQREGKEIKASTGMELFHKDTIRTGPKSSLEVMLEKTGIIKIAENSLVSLQTFYDQEGSRHNLQIKMGKVISVLKKQNKNSEFSVTTPTSVAGVRGTSFLTIVENPETIRATKKKVPCDTNCVVHFAVIEGSIAVKRHNEKDEVILERNTQLELIPGKKLHRKLIRPLGKRSLRELKHMVIFHKNDLIGYTGLIEELKKNNEELRRIEMHIELEETREKMMRNASRRNLADEVIKTAEKIDDTHYIKKEIHKDKLKLETNKNFED